MVLRNLPGSVTIRPIYGLYWTVGCILIGMIIAHQVTGPPIDPMSEGRNHHAHRHGKIEVDPNNAPGASVRVVKDALSGWNVYLTPRNFRFAPEKVNQANTANEGHAHLYLNGKKLTRLYGTSFHIDNMKPGRNVVTVTLNANDHSDLLLAGKPITAEAIVVNSN